MAIRVEPTAATLGATVTNVDLAALDAVAWQTVLDAFLQHAVLVFPGQHLSDDAQVAFARRFGELEHELAAISNRRQDGTILGMDAQAYWILRGNERWHIDSSFVPLAAKASCLTAIAVPSSGGETEWADMRAGYDALDAATQARIANLSALHSNYYSHEQLGVQVGRRPRTGDGYGFHPYGAPRRPLVKVHPVTGRKSLYIGRHAYGIGGMSAAASAALLDQLLATAAQPPRIVSHHWRPGDLVIWDNRCVLHRVQPYDYTQARVMRHTRVAGDPASELAPTERDERADAFEPERWTGPTPRRATIY